MRASKDRGDTYDDQTYATKLERREEIRQELWSAHLKSTTFALSEALRRVGMWDDAEVEFHAESLLAR